MARSRLESTLLSTYGLDAADNDCAVFPSGMAAISAILFSVLHENSTSKNVIVLGDELYCDTPRCAETWRNVFRATVESVDVRDGNKIIRLFQKYGNRVVLFFVESCSNPSAQMLDWSLLARLKELSPKCIVCIDNTWLTSALFNPFQAFLPSDGVVVDIVVESLSKYRSAGKCIGGMVVGRKAIVDVLKKFIRLNGLFVGADHCELFTAAQATLNERVLRASNVAGQVVDALIAVGGVTIVYPTLDTHPTHTIYSQVVECAGARRGPPVFWMHVESNCSFRDIMDSAYPAHLCKETSYGAAYSKIDPWPRLGLHNDYWKKPDGDDDDNDDDGDGKQGVWLRVSVGYNNYTAEALLAALQQVVQHYRQIM
jgi:cystathionine beta-lyase/cystathionine gamma-synthase